MIDDTNRTSSPGLLQKSENWISHAAAEAYSHPLDHLPEIAAAAVVTGSVAVLTKGAIARLLPEAAPEAEALASQNSESIISSGMVAREISGPIDSSMTGRTIGSFPLRRSLGDAAEYRLQGLPEGQSIAEQVSGLSRVLKPVNYGKIIPADSRVAVFAESHPVDEVRAELGREMPEFKRMGFTHLAMEALPSTRQPLIDNYYAGKATAAEVEAALKKDWGWSPGSYMYLIDTAKENGIKVIAADLKIGLKAASASPNLSEQVAMQDWMREKQWAKLITEPIEADPEARVMLLAGKKHTVIDPSIEQLTTMLSRNNLKPTVVEYTAGWQDADKRDVFDELVSTAGLSSKRFMVKLAESEAARPADVFVHLPSLYE